MAGHRTGPGALVGEGRRRRNRNLVVVVVVVVEEGRHSMSPAAGVGRRGRTRRRNLGLSLLHDAFVRLMLQVNWSVHFLCVPCCWCWLSSFFLSSSLPSKRSSALSTNFLKKDMVWVEGILGSSPNIS